ncbi:MAG: AgmX/PglI C-terminal domain-containing protein [Alphaproteobacteria bacterium]|nr:AgmX/PglI C-terminal domain-containing protein [Alphaproteobacteria bacterium]MCB9793493.1 AgmX/PglI C-terminal domain-containing protein [Alphaproteobacteria bacterium]
MGECPFCGEAVDAALILHGGPCPRCFNEIPGEEAATDPGAAKQAEEAAAVEAKVQRQRWKSGALVALLLAGMGGTYGYYAKKKADEEAILYMEFEVADDLFFIDPEELAALSEAPEPTPPPTGTPTGTPTGSPGGDTPRPPRGQPEGSSEGADQPDFGALEGKGEAAVAAGKDVPKEGSPTPGGTTLTGTSTLLPGVEARINTDQVLSSRDAIGRHIDSMMKVQAGRVRYCYVRALKVNPDFSGDFKLRFTVKEDGSTRDVSVTGAGLDPNFEACMVQEVATWRFAQLSMEAPVVYPLPLKRGR